MSLPEILGVPPDPIKKELEDLRTELDNQVPEKILDKNLLIATWNIWNFGNMTKKWIAGSNDSPKRDMQCVRIIAEIISRFDIVAIQEVKGNIRALRHMLKVLGPEWGLLLTDVNESDPGNWERIAFVFDSRRVQLSGLACELVIPENLQATILPDAFTRQFVRTPYAVSFKTGGSPLKKQKTFILATLHVIWGNNSQQRLPELSLIAKWMADWASDINAFDQNLIALGDFNIDRYGDPLYKAFTSTGLFVHPNLHNIPRSIFNNPSKPLDKHYDQIAWFNGDNDIPKLSLKYRSSGSFDFKQIALSSRNLTDRQIPSRISDHYPLWVEFDIE